MFSTTKNTLIRIIRVLSVYASDTTLKKSVPIRKSFVLCASNPYTILLCALYAQKFLSRVLIFKFAHSKISFRAKYARALTKQLSNCSISS